MSPWLEWRIGFGESIGCGGGRGLQMSSSLLKIKDLVLLFGGYEIKV